MTHNPKEVCFPTNRREATEIINCVSFPAANSVSQLCVQSYLAQVGCAGTPPHCTPRSPPCCSLSPAARTRCPSPTCRSQRCCRSLHPDAASPSVRRPVLLWSRLEMLLLAPRPAGDTPRRSARRVQSPGAVASTGRAGRRPGCAGYRSLEPVELWWEGVWRRWVYHVITCYRTFLTSVAQIYLLYSTPSLLDSRHQKVIKRHLSPASSSLHSQS